MFTFSSLYCGVDAAFLCEPHKHFRAYYPTDNASEGLSMSRLKHVFKVLKCYCNRAKYVSEEVCLNIVLTF